MDKPQAKTNLLDLALAGGDGNKNKAQEAIRRMKSEERRRLRHALSRLDNLLDADAINRHLRRDRK